MLVKKKYYANWKKMPNFLAQEKGCEKNSAKDG